MGGIVNGIKNVFWNDRNEQNNQGGTNNNNSPFLNKLGDGNNSNNLGSNNGGAVMNANKNSVNNANTNDGQKGQPETREGFGYNMNNLFL